SLVCVGERGRNVEKNSELLSRIDRCASFEHRPQRFTLDKRHREVGQPVCIPGSEHRNDMRMLKACRHHDLTLKAFDRNSSSGIRRENLYYDAAVEPGLGGEKDARHSSATELAV